MKNWYLGEIGHTYDILDKLENDQANTDGKNEAQKAVLQAQQLARRQALALKGYEIDKELNDKVIADAKTRAEEELRIAQESMREDFRLKDEGVKQTQAIQEELLKTGRETEREKLQNIKQAELDALDFKRQKLHDFIIDQKLTGKDLAKYQGEEGLLAAERERLKKTPVRTPEDEARQEVITTLTNLALQHE